MHACMHAQTHALQWAQHAMRADQPPPLLSGSPCSTLLHFAHVHAFFPRSAKQLFPLDPCALPTAVRRSSPPAGQLTPDERLEAAQDSIAHMAQALRQPLDSVNLATFMFRLSKAVTLKPLHSVRHRVQYMDVMRVSWKYRWQYVGCGSTQ